MLNEQRRKQHSLLGTPHKIRIRSYRVTIARGVFCIELVIAIFRGRFLYATNKFVTNHFRCVTKRHQHHTRSGVPCRMHKRRLNNESIQRAPYPACWKHTRRTENGARIRKFSYLKQHLYCTVAGRNVRSTYDQEGACAAARQHSHTLLRSS